MVRCSFSGSASNCCAGGLRMNRPPVASMPRLRRSVLIPTEIFAWTPASELRPTVAIATDWSWASPRSRLGATSVPKIRLAQRGW